MQIISMSPETCTGVLFVYLFIYHSSKGLGFEKITLKIDWEELNFPRWAMPDAAC